MRSTRDGGLWFGLGRADITACVAGMSMWGWGSTHNVPVGAAAPLHARAIVLAEDCAATAPIVFVTVELGMVSEALRTAALEALQRRGIDVDAHRFTITATHTHSGPSGFSTYLFYQAAGPGFSQPLVDRLATGVVAAVCAALESLAPGRVHSHAEDLPLIEPVCFNRSLAAYNRNLDVAPVAADRGDEAVSRRMTVLRFEDAFGRARGLLAIFGVHGTSIHADNNLLHPDNPGIAASECERAAARDGCRDFVCLFVQAAAGDVSPNYRWSAQRGLFVGRYDDDFEAAAACGEAQAKHALRLLAAASTLGTELAGPLVAELHTVRFDQTEVDADLVRAGECSSTSVARLGVSFCLGTREGPGPLGSAPTLVAALGGACSLLSRDRDLAHDPKPVLWDLGPGGDKRIAGRFESSHPLLALWDDRRMRFYRAALAEPGALTRPWVPHTLPFQILRIGSFAAALVPFEPTTVAGRRIRSTVADALAATGVRHVEVLGYANAYASYLTTPEEYDEQAYEGAATLFGRASLPAVCSRLRAVARGIAAQHLNDDTRLLTIAPGPEGSAAFATAVVSNDLDARCTG